MLDRAALSRRWAGRPARDTTSGSHRPSWPGTSAPRGPPVRTGDTVNTGQAPDGGGTERSWCQTARSRHRFAFEPPASWCFSRRPVVVIALSVCSPSPDRPATSGTQARARRTDRRARSTGGRVQPDAGPGPGGEPGRKAGGQSRLIAGFWLDSMPRASSRAASAGRPARPWRADHGVFGALPGSLSVDPADTVSPGRSWRRASCPRRPRRGGEAIAPVLSYVPGWRETQPVTSSPSSSAPDRAGGAHWSAAPTELLILVRSHWATRRPWTCAARRGSPGRPAADGSFAPARRAITGRDPRRNQSSGSPRLSPNKRRCSRGQPVQLLGRDTLAQLRTSSSQAGAAVLRQSSGAW